MLKEEKALENMNYVIMKVIFLKAFKYSQQNKISKSWFRKKERHGDKVNERDGKMGLVFSRHFMFSCCSYVLIAHKIVKTSMPINILCLLLSHHNKSFDICLFDRNVSNVIKAYLWITSGLMEKRHSIFYYKLLVILQRNTSEVKKKTKNSTVNMAFNLPSVWYILLTPKLLSFCL